MARHMIVVTAALAAASVVGAMNSFVFFGPRFGHQQPQFAGSQFRQPAQFQSQFRQPTRFGGFQPQAAGFGGFRDGRAFQGAARPASNTFFRSQAGVPAAVQGIQSAAVAPQGRPDSQGRITIDGHRYLFSWVPGHGKLSWPAAQQYCADHKMKMISLETTEKADKFFGLVRAYRQEYFWTGGQVDDARQLVSWPGAAPTPIVRGQHPFSYTGRTGPQPDGGEVCLAVLNDVYRDGPKFHDVACHHEKPVICEE